MNYKIKFLAVCLLSLLLNACASTRESKFITPTIKYNGTVTAHVPKKAYLFWQHGLEQLGETPPFQGGGVAGMVGSIIDAQVRKNNPSKYHLSYGKVQQVAFVTNFRDVLADNRVFKNVEIITNPAQAKPDGILIDVKFKSTRVGGFEHNYKIMLTVEMMIKSGKSTFTRTYLTESDEGTFFNGKSYNEQMGDASQQMINKLMNGINQWSRSH
ncbi:MAG: hypothetical protein ACYC0J_09740 [Gammaproteobacteria bacterium]